MDDAQSSKRCSRCGETKPLSEFQPRKDRNNAYRSRCQECEKLLQRENRAKRADEINARRRAKHGNRREAQRAALAEAQRQYMAWYEAQKPESVETGACWCGCGEWAPVSHSTNGHRGYVAGCPQRFIKGHQGHRGATLRYIEADAGYDTPCWLWQRGTSDNGYGIHHGTYAHRIFYEQEYGPIPDGWHVHHQCWNVGCVRPSHLEAMPPKQHRRESVYHRTLTEGEIQDIKDGRARGVPVKVLAEKHGIKQSTVSKVAPQSNYKKLTSEQKTEAQRLRELGWLHKDIAAKFGKDTSTITRMLNGGR